ncbi:hypothetical protein GW17_00022167 [Ensete ventricosum]|nr:hypothetical protein GW17_00022167 [Ensete ventricosum]
MSQKHQQLSNIESTSGKKLTWRTLSSILGDRPPSLPPRMRILRPKPRVGTGGYSTTRGSIPSGRFLYSLIERLPTIMPEMLQRTIKYIVAKVLVTGKHEDHKRSRMEKPQSQPSEP